MSCCSTQLEQRVLGRHLRHRYVRSPQRQYHILPECKEAFMACGYGWQPLGVADDECGVVAMQIPAEQPDTRDWHARRELPPMPEGQKQSAKQGNDPVQRTEPLPVRREGSQQDLRPRNNQHQNAEWPAASNGPAAATPSAVGDYPDRGPLRPACFLCHGAMRYNSRVG